MSQLIDVMVADRVQTIRMNRPEKKNALTSEMYAAMAAALNRLRTMRDAPSQLPENLTAFGIRGEGLMKLMATHPPLEERIARLQAQS